MLNIWRRPLITFVVATLTFGISGLTSSTVYADALEDRENALNEREQRLKQREQALENKLANIQGKGAAAFSDMEDVLPTAKAGQCFAKVLVPAKFEDRTDKITVREAAHNIKITPPQYKTVVEKITIEEATENVLDVPVVYKKVEEKVLVKDARKVWRKGLSKKSKKAPADWVAAGLSNGVPKDAPVKSCYEEFLQPAKFETEEKKLIKKQAATRIEIVPAKYEWVEKKVLVKEASENIVEVPPVYEIKEEKVLEKAAYTTWKRGRGPIERIDHSTGEIMCLVDVPAQYKTIRKKIVKTPASTKKITVPAEFKIVKVRKLISPVEKKEIKIPETYQVVKKTVLKSNEVINWRPENTVGEGSPTGKKICRVEIPAKYQTVVKQMVDKPATTKKVAVPAKLRDVKVSKLVNPAKESKVEIPAKYENVTKRVKIAEEKLAWRSVLCETNTTKELLAEIQSALQKAGFDPGPADGSMGRKSQVALREFQKKNGLETGGITLSTLAALGVKVGSKP